MTYSKQTWTPNVTPVDAAHMQHIEDGIAAVEAEIPPPLPAVVNGQWIKGVGGAAVWSPITVADVSGAEATANKGANSGYAGLDASGSLYNLLLALSAAVLRARVNGDTQDRFVVQNDGHHYWGSGAAAVDTGLYRSAASTLKTDGDLQSAGSVYAAAGSAANQILLGSNGTIYFSTAGDAILYRSAAGVLRTAILDANAFTINGKAIKVTGAYIDSTGAVTGNRGITCAHSAGSGLYQITFPAMSYPVVTVTPTSTLTMAAAQLVSGTSVNIFTTSGGAPVDTGINVVILDANG